ncbi:MAG: hypothetical protein COA93_09785 [Alphaproteobacteria bacterium]|nr:MAG: hypothetical protein COA93_09785 [Alphaproteobacteria bacterium]
MANTITFISCGVLTLLLLIAIMFAGSHLLLPAIFMIVTILVGGYCIYIADGMIKQRAEIMKKWED